MSRRWCLLVHAGAGSHVDAPDVEAAYRRAMRRACLAGRDALLCEGGTSLRACTAAVGSMEDDACCNAGYGANLTEDGTVECDASAMDGATRTFGACGATMGVRHPVRLAERLLMRQREGPRPLGRVHPMVLVGEGARRWAESQGLEMIEPTSQASPKAVAAWKRFMQLLREEEARDAAEMLGPAPREDVGRKRPRPDINECAEETMVNDTVGAVCCDGMHVAATVSSGGIWLKHSGRVGEAAAFGAGCWASNAAAIAANDTASVAASVAASVSGQGEQVMRALLAQAVCEALRAEDGASCHDVAVRCLRLPSSSGSEGVSSSHAHELQAGLIALRRAPPDSEAAAAPAIEMVVAHTTPSFAVGYIHHARTQPKAFISRRQPEVTSPRVLCASASQPAQERVTGGLGAPC